MMNQPTNSDTEAFDDAPLLRVEPIPAESLQQVRDIIEALRPNVQRDGGDLELVEVQGNLVRLRLKGACVGCSLAAQTLGGVRRALVQALGNPGIRVVPAV
ncbi:NifU-like protein [Azomonas agilis]|uniref:NifU-like protein n=1 Tax=Azomonas agilis TaxID=116849 RepID=A0A562IZ92_9GAMM|nr:NifU family protein [Azomonas agilis]TWH76160.1 NifU-like protein [Azomonas agilis]